MADLPEHIRELMRDHPMGGMKFRAIRVDTEALPLKARLIGDFDLLQPALDAIAAARAEARKTNERAEFAVFNEAGEPCSTSYPSDAPRVQF